MFKKIYLYYKQLELEQRISIDNIPPEIRQQLVEWMYEACDELQLDREIYFLAVAIMDHFLDLFSVLQSELGVVGASCIGLASKYEDRSDTGLDFSELGFVSAHRKEPLIETEWIILQTLNFNLGFITPNHFMDYFWNSVEFQPREKHASHWMLELAMTDSAIVSKYLPSEIAASTIYLTRMLGGSKPIWSPSLEQITGFIDKSLHPCIKALIARLRREASLLTPSFISTKYEDSSRSRVSLNILSFYRKY